MSVTQSFPHLVNPGRIGKLDLRNRIVMSPMGSNFAEDDGYCGERIQAYYEARAVGGAGLLIMGVCSVAYPAGSAEPYQVGVSSDDYIPGLRGVAARAHRHGAKIAMQLQHAGKTAVRDMVEGRPLWLPSIPKQQPSDMMKALTKDELGSFLRSGIKGPPQIHVMDKGDIQQMTEWFAAAAARAQEAGFDAVEVHAAHTYIIAGFLSPYYNQREDEYGGSLENRARLMVEILIAIRQRVGPDFGLWLRLDGEELRTPGGIGIVDAQAAAKLAVAAGAQAVNISAYASITTGAAFTEAPLVHTPGGFVGYAQAIKAAVAVPVIVAGRLNAEAAEAALAAGHCDFVAMARPLLADPDLPNKLAAGRLQDVRPCIYCYTCVSEIFFNRRVKCAVNPLTGHEFEDAINPAATPKRVLVVGGGPAGMEAARVAALRGHRVTLVERSDRLGGTLFFAALAAPENAPLLDYLVAQVGSLPIEVRLNTEVTLALVASLKAETIIVATGALRAPQPFPGSAQKHVWNGDELRRLLTGDRADEIARNKLNLAERALFKAGGMIGATGSQQALQKLSHLWMPLGNRVVIVGGGLVGLELAEFLAARGRDVTVIEKGEKFGREFSLVRRWRVLDDVGRHGVQLIAQATVQEITSQQVIYTDAEGAQHALDADSVVLAIGTQADDSVARRLGAGGVPVYQAGDGAAVGYIEGAIHSGNRIARSI